MHGTSWKSFIVVCRWCFPSNKVLLECFGCIAFTYTVAQSSLSILKVVCPLCFAFGNHAYYSHGSSASTITSSKITKVWELHVFRTSQDTNTLHLQHGSLEVCDLYSWLLDFWPIEARRQSSNGAISWAIRFATSNLVGVSSNESPSHNNNAHTRRWNWKCYNSVATRIFDRTNRKTQPKAECHVLQLKHPGAQKVILPLLFDALKQHGPASAERKAESRSAKIAETAKTLSTSMFWSSTTYNLCLYVG